MDPNDLIKYEAPPNFAAICAVFPDAVTHEGAIFSYAPHIYAPKLTPGQGLAPHLHIHEQVHHQQQKAIGGPEIWWERYLADVNFRLEQEIEAYRAQYQFVLTNHGNNRGTQDFLFKIACDLSGPLYGNIISYGAAESKIRRKN